MNTGQAYNTGIGFDLPLFRKIAVAIAFNNRRQGLMAEAKRMKDVFGAQLVVIHIGQRTEHYESQLEQLLLDNNLATEDVQVHWDDGDPVRSIIGICQQQGVDLLIAGANQQQNFFQFYLGSIGREIMRQASCSVLVITDPSKHLVPLDSMLTFINNDKAKPALVDVSKRIAMEMATTHLFYIEKVEERSITGHGLGQHLGERLLGPSYTTVKHHVAKIKQDIISQLEPWAQQHDITWRHKLATTDLTKLIYQFVARARINLVLIHSTGNGSLLDRFLQTEEEQLLSDLPCNLLLLRQPYLY